jgi:transposase
MTKPRRRPCVWSASTGASTPRSGLRSRRLAKRLGMTGETLRKWVRQAEIDCGDTPGTTSESARELRELKRKNAELERTIEILKEATAFFVRECDPQRR